MRRIKKPSYNVSIISFDLDDTLWPVEPTILAAEQNFYRLIQNQYPRISSAQTLEEMRTYRIAYMQARPHMHHDLSTLRTQFITQLLQQFDYPDDEGSLMQQFKKDRNNVSFYPGTLEALDKLSQSFKLVACTNGNADVFKTEAGQFFSASISSEEVGVAKPDIRIFDHLCKSLGCRAPDVLHVGDNPQTDALGALHAGMHSVWFNPEQLEWPHPQRPHGSIAHLNDLFPLLKL